MPRIIEDKNRELILQIKQGSYHYAKSSLSQGAHVDCVDHIGRTPLMLAAAGRNKYSTPEEDFTKIVRMLLAANANVNHQSDSEDTALIIAASNGMIEIVRELIQHGARVDLVNTFNKTALSAALNIKRLDIALMLIKSGADVDDTSDDGTSCLMLAASNGMIEIVRELKKDFGADLEAFDTKHRNALIIAISRGHNDVAAYLIEEGANVNYSDEIGYTPLIHAVIKGNDSIAQMLIKAGANLDAVDEEGYTALIHASTKGNIAIVQKLIGAGAEIDAISDYGETALIQAALNGHESVVRILMYAGADINSVSLMHDSALMCVAINGNKEIAQMLINAQAWLDTENDESERALILAASNGHEAIVQMLIDAGDNIDYYTVHGETALNYAIKNNRHNVAKILLKAGASLEKLYYESAFLSQELSDADQVDQILEDLDKISDEIEIFKRENGIAAERFAKLFAKKIVGRCIEASEASESSASASSPDSSLISEKEIVALKKLASIYHVRQVLIEAFKNEIMIESFDDQELDIYDYFAKLDKRIDEIGLGRELKEFFDQVLSKINASYMNLVETIISMFLRPMTFEAESLIDYEVTEEGVYKPNGKDLEEFTSYHPSIKFLKDQCAVYGYSLKDYKKLPWKNILEKLISGEVEIPVVVYHDYTDTKKVNTMVLFKVADAIETQLDEDPSQMIKGNAFFIEIALENIPHSYAIRNFFKAYIKAAKLLVINERLAAESGIEEPHHPAVDEIQLNDAAGVPLNIDLAGEVDV